MQSVFLVSVWTALVFVTSVVHFHKHRYHSPRCVVDAFAPVMPRLVAGRTRSAAIITTAKNNFAGRHGSAATVAVCNLSSEPNDYLEKASRLRQEASDLESKLLQDNERNKLGRRFAEDEVSEPLPPIYKTMDNSVWTLTYRFASTPEPSESKAGKAADAAANAAPRTFYSGKLTLKFREDGYTDLLDHASEAAGLKVSKAWGWDVELSEKKEDPNEYLLFSIDATIPESDTAAPALDSRFYFQARKDRNGSTGAIELKEGTVTIKSEALEQPSSVAGFFGFLSPKGILAQFRYVGNFVCRPSSAP